MNSFSRIIFLFIIFTFSELLPGTKIFVNSSLSRSGFDNLWSNPNNWDGGSLPVSGDNVIIYDYCVIDVNIATIQINDLTIESSGALVGSGAVKTVFINGDIYNSGAIGDGTTIGAMNILFNGDDHVVYGEGNIYANAFYKSTATNLTTNLKIQQDITLLRAGASALFNNSSNTGSVFNVTIENDATVTVPSGSVSISGANGTETNRGTMNLTIGTVNGGGALVVAQKVVLLSALTSGISAINIGTNGTRGYLKTGEISSGNTGGRILNLNLGPQGKIEFTSSGWKNPGTGIAVSLDQLSTVEFNNAGDQTVEPVAVYGNLILAGSGIKTIKGTVTVAGTVALKGAVAVSGSPVYSGASSTLEYNGSGIQITTNNEFPATNGPHNLTIKNPNGVVLHASRTIQGDLSIPANYILTNNAGTLAVLGSVSNNGLINGLARLSMEGTENEMLSGNGIINDLEVKKNSAQILIEEGSDITMVNQLRLTSGELVNNGKIILKNNLEIVKGNGRLSGEMPEYVGMINLTYNSSGMTTNELPANPDALYNMVVNAPVTLSEDAYVNGVLTLNAALNLESNTLKIENPIGGNLNNVNPGNFLGNMILDGTMDNMYVPAKNFNKIIIENNNNVFLSGNTTINEIDFTSGNLLTGSFALTVNSPAGVMNETSGHMIIGNLKSGPVNNPGQDFFSNLGFYHPPISGTAISFFRKTGDNAFVQVGSNSSVNRSYVLTGNSMNINGPVKLVWSSSELNGKSVTSAKIYELVQSNNTWYGRSPEAGEEAEYDEITGNYSLTATLSTNLTGASQTSFTVSDVFSPLPVELLEFTGVVKNESVVISWKTATEVQNSGWYIERKSFSAKNQNEWVEAGFVEGSRNSNSPKNYTFREKSFLYGEYYYRLKQVDLDGTIHYSNEIKINIGKLPVTLNLHNNFPNPFNPETSIRFELPAEGKVILTIYNSLGEKIKELHNEQMQAGIYQSAFNGKDLPSGVYISVLEFGGNRIVRKMNLIK